MLGLQVVKGKNEGKSGLRQRPSAPNDRTEGRPAAIQKSAGKDSIEIDGHGANPSKRRRKSREDEELRDELDKLISQYQGRY